MKPLKPLAEWNEQRQVNYQNKYDSIPNGLACPWCGKELMDTCPAITLASYPPKKDVHCSNCTYKGYRVA